MDRAHAFAVGVERYLRNTGEKRIDALPGQASLCRGDDERPLRRVPDHAVAVRALRRRGVFFQARVTGQHPSLEEEECCPVAIAGELGAAAVPLHLTAGLPSLPGDGEGLSVRPEERAGHLVLGKRARLVRADHRRAPEGLHGREPADEGVALDHLAHSQREADGDDRRQPLRNRGDREAHRGEEHHQDVAALHDPHEEHHGADGERRDAQPPAHLGELLLQRGRFVDRFFQDRGDEPHGDGKIDGGDESWVDAPFRVQKGKAGQHADGFHISRGNPELGSIIGVVGKNRYSLERKGVCEVKHADEKV